MLAMLGRAKGRSDKSRDLVRPVASILCTLVSHRYQHPQFGRDRGMYLDHIGTVDMFGAGYSLCTPCEHMAEEYSDIQPSQYFTFPISILSLRASFYRHQYSFDRYYSTIPPLRSAEIHGVWPTMASPWA